MGHAIAGQFAAVLEESIWDSCSGYAVGAIHNDRWSVLQRLDSAKEKGKNECNDLQAAACSDRTSIKWPTRSCCLQNDRLDCAQLEVVIGAASEQARCLS